MNEDDEPPHGSGRQVLPVPVPKGSGVGSDADDVSGAAPTDHCSEFASTVPDSMSNTCSLSPYEHARRPSSEKPATKTPAR